MAQLDIEGLCKGWDFPVLDRLDLSVKEGEFFVIVGPSGIGKTTLLRLVAGLERPDAGRIVVGGQDITARPPYRRPVAMTFESYALYPHLTVFENIASPLRARRLGKGEIAQRVQAVAKLLRIDALLDRYPGEVSGGQKQRTALGRTLVADPEVFLLDEPLSHLDAKIRHELRQQFHTLEALRSVATLYVTHDYAEALSLGDRIGVMGNGGLVQVGEAREVFERPANLFVAQHLGQPSINTLSVKLGEENGGMIARSDGGLHIPVAPVHAQGLSQYGDGAVTLGIRPQHIRVRTSEGGAHKAETGGEIPGGDWGVEAEVELFEALGAVGVLVAAVQSERLTVLTSPDRVFAPGQPLELRLHTEAFLYFASTSGDNLFA